MVQTCHVAGIRVVVITVGDKVAARAAAESCGIITDRGGAWKRFIVNERLRQGDYFKNVFVRPRDGGKEKIV